MNYNKTMFTHVLFSLICSMLGKVCAFTFTSAQSDVGLRDNTIIDRDTV
jgi:hypothetical protein